MNHRDPVTGDAATPPRDGARTHRSGSPPGSASRSSPRRPRRATGRSGCRAVPHVRAGVACVAIAVDAGVPTTTGHMPDDPSSAPAEAMAAPVTSTGTGSSTAAASIASTAASVLPRSHGHGRMVPHGSTQGRRPGGRGQWSCQRWSDSSPDAGTSSTGCRSNAARSSRGRHPSAQLRAGDRGWPRSAVVARCRTPAADQRRSGGRRPPEAPGGHAWSVVRTHSDQWAPTGAVAHLAPLRLGDRPPAPKSVPDPPIGDTASAGRQLEERGRLRADTAREGL